MTDLFSLTLFSMLSVFSCVFPRPISSFADYLFFYSFLPSFSSLFLHCAKMPDSAQGRSSVGGQSSADRYLSLVRYQPPYEIFPICKSTRRIWALCITVLPFRRGRAGFSVYVWCMRNRSQGVEEVLEALSA